MSPGQKFIVVAALTVTAVRSSVLMGMVFNSSEFTDNKIAFVLGNAMHIIISIIALCCATS